jgi:hypothetical protein
LPLILIAGTVAGQPKAEPFPAKGRPRCELRLAVEDDNCVTLYRVVGFDEQMADLEVLVPGDGVCVQGTLRFEQKDKKIVDFFVVAGQIMPLRRKSPNLRFAI